jgi:hypothetical protein
LHHAGLLHIPRLRLQLVALRFVLFPLLEDFEGFLFDGCFAGAVAHLGELLLVGGKLGIKLRQLDVDALLEMALLSVGLGALLLAPNRRFMLAGRECSVVH